jgi:hypothetical protein
LSDALLNQSDHQFFYRRPKGIDDLQTQKKKPEPLGKAVSPPG